MSAFVLPFADAVLKPHDILSTGATALTTILLGYRHMYHNLVCIINEAEDFYEVSNDIIMAKFDDSCKGNAVTFNDLLENSLMWMLTVSPRPRSDARNVVRV
jgi:hypothetical protein